VRFTGELALDITRGFLILRPSFPPDMANKKSAIKNTRKNTRRRTRNQRVQSRLKTLAKGMASAAGADDAETARKAAKAYISALDKAAIKGIISRNSANRHKAVCSKFVITK
jgi:small subunit ribosomal protein S20